ncbi:hypothetical protein AAHA92_12330 [Salvia divinorum]|uniref:Uncharacterized protein n=1 Tax=Salvia divinorum TaxID=28513 RepID=A0ABD1HK17_SALDI
MGMGKNHHVGGYGYFGYRKEEKHGGYGGDKGILEITKRRLWGATKGNIVHPIRSFQPRALWTGDEIYKIIKGFWKIAPLHLLPLFSIFFICITKIPPPIILSPPIVTTTEQERENLLPSTDSGEVIYHNQNPKNR